MTRSFILTPFAILWLISASYGQQSGRDALDEWAKNYGALGLDMTYASAAEVDDKLTVQDLKFSYAKEFSFNTSGGDSSSDANKESLDIKIEWFSPTAEIDTLTADESGISIKHIVFADNTTFDFSLKPNEGDSIELAGTINGYEIDGLFEKRAGEDNSDSSSVISDWLPLINYILGLRYDEARISTLTYGPGSGQDKETADIIGTTTMSDLVVKGVRDGRMAESTQGQTKQVTQSVGPDGSPLAMSVTSESTRMIGFDVKPILALVAPEVVGKLDSYEILDSTTTSDYRVDAGEFKANIAGVSARSMGLDSSGISLMPMIDALVAGQDVDPKQLITTLFNVYRGLSIGEFLIGETTLEFPIADQASTTMRGEIGRIQLIDLNSDGLGSFSIESADFDNQSDKAFKLGKLAVGGIEFAPYGPMETIIGTLTSGDEPDPLAAAKAFLPLSLTIEISDAYVKGPDENSDSKEIIEVSLDSVLLKTESIVPPIPTSLQLSAEGIEVPVSVMDDRAQALFGAAGLEDLRLTNIVRARWDQEGENLIIDELTANIREFAKVSGKASVGGVTQSVLENPDQLQTALVTLSLNEIELELTNEGGVQAALETEAKLAGVSAQDFSAGLLQQLSGLLAFVNNETFATMVTDAATKFLDDPRSLTLSVAPANPVAFAQIIGTVAVAPQTLPDILGISVTAD